MSLKQELVEAALKNCGNDTMSTLEGQWLVAKGIVEEVNSRGYEIVTNLLRVDMQGYVKVELILKDNSGSGKIEMSINLKDILENTLDPS